MYNSVHSLSFIRGLDIIQDMRQGHKSVVTGLNAELLYPNQNAVEKRVADTHGPWDAAGSGWKKRKTLHYHCF